jgi:putative ABC transport system permease protein
MSERFHHPPKIPRWIVRHILPQTDKLFLGGDFDEIYNSIHRDKGQVMADFWYWHQLIQSLPRIAFNSFYWSFVMLKNYLKITLRHLQRQKGYSLINIAGLSVGMACFILIILFINYEFSYEEHHANADRIYKIYVEHHLPTGVNRIRSSPVPLAETLHNEIPEIQDFTRMQTIGNPLVHYDDRGFYEDGVVFVDPGIFTMFNFHFVAGDTVHALKDKNSAVLTEDMAVKYFGRENPIGKSLVVNNRHSILVNGVIKNHPENSNLQPDILISFSTIEDIAGKAYMTNWLSQIVQSYILIPENASIPQLEEKIQAAFKKHVREDDDRILKLDQFSRMHLYSELEDTGDIKTIYIFMAIGFLIILTACINFMNLATARSVKRAKEVGLRKVVGAVRGQLIKQFIGESAIFSALSLFLALILVFLFLPTLNNLTGQFVRFEDLGRAEIFLSLIGIVLLVGFLSGSYPALFLSAFQPANVLKGTLKSGTKGGLFRKILVVAQFGISIILIVCTIILNKQLHYIQNRPLGFKKDQIVVIRNSDRQRKIAPLKEELLRNPNIAGVAGSLQLPSSIGMYNNVTWEGAVGEEQTEIIHNRVDYDFLDTYEIELLAGRNFSKEYPSDQRGGRDADSARSIIINEEAVRRFGWEDPIGKRVIQVYGERRIYFTVIGVVKDFHFSSLRNPIKPMNFFLSPDSNRYISAKMLSQDISGTLKFIEETWKKLAPESPIEYFFLDTVFERRYRSEERLQRLFSYFSGLAIFIACLGLFGLASFAAEQRTKEIGIRKILGASETSLIFLLSKEFTLLVLIANLVAWPLAYLVMHNWLEGFAYRIQLNNHLGFFLLASAVALVIAWLTVSFQAIKASLVNPIDSLRYE